MNEILESKNIYYNKYFEENKSNMKMLWKGIKGIISLSPGKLDAISYLNSKDGTKISDSVKITTEFNNYFTNVASSITKKIPRTPKSPLDYLSNPNLDSFFISPCTSDEISILIQSLKLGKSSGPRTEPWGTPQEITHKEDE